MSPRLDLLTSPGEAGASAVERQHARARQDRWMLEIERQMLLTGPKEHDFAPAAHSAHDGRARPGAGRSPAQLENNAQTARPQEPAVVRHARAGGVNAHGTAAVQDYPSARAERNPAVIPFDSPARDVVGSSGIGQAAQYFARGFEASAAQSTSPDRDDADVTPIFLLGTAGPASQRPFAGSEPEIMPSSVPRTGPGPLHMSVVQGPAVVAADASGAPPAIATRSANPSAGLADVGALPTKAGLVGPVLGPANGAGNVLGLATLSAARPVGSTAPAVGAVHAVLAAAPAVPAHLEMGSQHFPADLKPGADDEEAAAPHRTQGRRTLLDSGEPYARNNLHVLAGEEGVQAWIRDADLTLRQGQAVALAMAAQFAQQGTAVASLTINGRVHLKGGRTYELANGATFADNLRPEVAAFIETVNPINADKGAV